MAYSSTYFSEVKRGYNKDEVSKFISKMNSEHDAALEKKDERIKELISENELLKSRAEDAEKTIAELQAKLEEAEQINESLTEEAKQKDETIAELRRLSDEKDSRISELKELCEKEKPEEGKSADEARYSAMCAEMGEKMAVADDCAKEIIEKANRESKRIIEEAEAKAAKTDEKRAAMMSVLAAEREKILREAKENAAELISDTVNEAKRNLERARKALKICEAKSAAVSSDLKNADDQLCEMISAVSSVAEKKSRT